MTGRTGTTSSTGPTGHTGRTGPTGPTGPTGTIFTGAGDDVTSLRLLDGTAVRSLTGAAPYSFPRAGQVIALAGPAAITWAGDGSATSLGVSLVSNMAGVQIRALK